MYENGKSVTVSYMFFYCSRICGTYFVIMNRLAHENQKVGLACAMAIILLVIIIICTVAQKLFFQYVFTDGNSDESKSAIRKRKKEEKNKKRMLKEGVTS